MQQLLIQQSFLDTVLHDFKIIVPPWCKEDFGKNMSLTSSTWSDKRHHGASTIFRFSCNLLKIIRCFPCGAML